MKKAKSISPQDWEPASGLGRKSGLPKWIQHLQLGIRGCCRLLCGPSWQRGGG